MVYQSPIIREFDKAKTYDGNEFDIAKKCGNEVDGFGWPQRN